MSGSKATASAVFVHGAWADGSSCARVTATGGRSVLTQGRQEVFGRLQICRIQAFHERLDYRL